jgi:predicted nucleotidyltransferase
MQPFITEKLPEIIELCRTHHVRRFSVFGSAVRDDFNPATSDVDVRVEFEHYDKIPNYVTNLHDLHDSLTDMLGRKVDLLSGAIQNPYLRAEIDSTKVTLYAA